MSFHNISCSTSFYTSSSSIFKHFEGFKERNHRIIFTERESQSMACSGLHVAMSGTAMEAAARRRAHTAELQLERQRRLEEPKRMPKAL